MNKHTPGPWVQGRDANGECIMFQRTDQPYIEPNFEWQANLRLMDAAPDLLAVARDWAAGMTMAGVEPNAESNNPLESILARTIAAIDKAEGRCS